MKRRRKQAEAPASPSRAARLRAGLSGKEPLLAVAVVLAAFALSLGAFVRAGRGAVEVLAISLPDPPASSGQMLMQLLHPGPAASAFDVTFALSAKEGEGIWRLPAEARLEVQADTMGRSIRVGLSNPNDSGSETFVRVADRGWIDLGPIPSNLAPRTVRIRAAGDGRFALLRPLDPSQPDLRQIEANVADASRPTGAQGPPRYRLVVPRAVPPLETLARLFALPGMSGVLAVALAAGVAFVLAGAGLLFRRPVAGVLLSVAGVALVHLALRPALHGEDEPSHAGTVEFLVFAPEQLAQTSLPRSIEALGDALDLDRTQFNGEQVLPLRDAKERARARAALVDPALDLARSAGGVPVSQSTLDVDARAPLYYRVFRPLRPLFARLGLLDRFSAYRLFSSLLALAAFSAGTLLLAWAFPGPGKALLFGISALLPPYLMSLLTTVSNYSVSIGFGQLMAAALVTTVASDRNRARLAGGLVLLVTTAAALGTYRDFAGFLPAAFLLAVVGAPALVGAWTWRRGGRARTAGVILAAAGLGATAWLAWTGLLARPDRISRIGAFVLARKPLGVPDPADPVWLFVAQVVLAPLALGLVLALLGLLGRRLSPEVATRLAAARTAAGATLFLALFFVTTFSPVPTSTRLDFPGEVLAHWNAFWSTNFGFDQDLLSWKLYWGVFGWTDTFYPDVVYAVAKWACVALFLALPLLCKKTQRERPWVSALLLVFSGLAVSLAVVSNTARFFGPSNPWGRFILPWVPLALFPALARIDLDQKRETVLKWVLVAAVCFHLWTAITVVGVRYFIPR